MTDLRLLWAVALVFAVMLAGSMVANGYRADRDGTHGGLQTPEIVLAVVCVVVLVAAVAATRRARRDLVSRCVEVGGPGRLGVRSRG